VLTLYETLFHCWNSTIEVLSIFFTVAGNENFVIFWVFLEKFLRIFSFFSLYLVNLSLYTWFIYNYYFLIFIFLIFFIFSFFFFTLFLNKILLFYSLHFEYLSLYTRPIYQSIIGLFISFFSFLSSFFCNFSSFFLKKYYTKLKVNVVSL
jgi:hypothetical protein